MKTCLVVDDSDHVRAIIGKRLPDTVVFGSGNPVAYWRGA